MSEESTTPDSVERVRRQFEAGNRRDIDAVMSSFAVDAVLEGRALGDIFEGHAAIRAFVEAWFGMYEELEFKLEEVNDSATELCLLWSSKRLGLLASPIAFSRERDGSTCGWEA
jgi:ketosteroid isomerase-like protein